MFRAGSKFEADSKRGPFGTRRNEQLREAALALVQQLSQQKAANSWMANRASESENSKLEMLATMIRQRPAEE